MTAKLQYILFFCFACFLSFSQKAQIKKDTLFFSFDKYYTILSDNGTSDYLNWIKETNEQMSHTKTNGYVYVNSHSAPVKNLQPKKVLPIKEYLENRNFYFDGKYNRIVENSKVKRFLTDKYFIFLVRGNDFIEAKNLEYASYYPRRDKDWNVVENHVKDTLFFKLDTSYIYKSEHFPGQYFLREKENEGSFFLEEVKTHKNLRLDNNILDLKNFIRSSSLYNKSTKQFNVYRLCTYLYEYKIILVGTKENEVQYIEVSAGQAIE